MVSTPKYYEVTRNLIHEVCDLFNTPEMMAIEMDEENGLNPGRLQYACYRQRGLQGGSNVSTFNFEHNIRYATENADLNKIVGMSITGCWSPIDSKTKYYYFDSINQAKYTREQFFGGK